jgi:hypothetical protein
MAMDTLKDKSIKAVGKLKSQKKFLKKITEKNLKTK